MSKFTQLPYIESILSELSADNKQILLNNINGKSADGTEDIAYALKTISEMSSLETGVYAVVYNYSTTIAWKGYVVITENYKVFITFKNFKVNQTDAEVFDIQSDDLVYRETVSADYIRTLLREDEYIDSAELADAISQGGGGLPEADGPNKVIVSNEDNEGEWKASVPMADNLVAPAINNDSAYNAGPTGGFADIATGYEAYLAEVKGNTVCLNQMMPDSGSFTLNPNHRYICIYNTNNNPKMVWTYFTSSSNTLTNNTGTSSTIRYRKVFDLTLMFGSNDKIPFEWTFSVTEYPANGAIPAQVSNFYQRLCRLFPDLDFTQVPYNPTGTLIYANPTKIVEVGRNLWDASTMDGDEGTGLRLLPGYSYEIYTSGTGSSPKVKSSIDGGSTWNNCQIFIRQRADGKYIASVDSSYSNTPYLIKSDESYPIVYVGFVHSGNYCLTKGTDTYTSRATTNVAIPTYEKHEFPIIGVSNLKSAIDACDTTDTQRVGIVENLSTLTWTAGTGTFSATVPGIKPSTTNVRGTLYSREEISVDENGIVTITTSSSPTGTLLYELAEPVSTGNSAFEPIALKDNDKWVVDDMGLEYFIESSTPTIPMNQLSIYYSNLKDKLVNLQIPEIDALPWNINAENLSGLKINDKAYKMVPMGNCNYFDYQQICIGQGASLVGDSAGDTRYSVVIGGHCSKGQMNTVVGYGASGKSGDSRITSIGVYSGTDGSGGTPGSCAVSIGHYAWAKGSYCTAIGPYSYAVIPYTVCADAKTDSDTFYSSNQRTWMYYDPKYLFFRFENNKSTKTTFDSYLSGHYLSEYIQNNTLTQETGTNKFYLEWTDSSNYKTITKNVASGTETVINKQITGMHITVRLANNIVCGFDLLPYSTDAGSAFIAYAVCDSNASVMSAYLDSDGVVILSGVPGSTTVSEVKYYLR